MFYDCKRHFEHLRLIPMHINPNVKKAPEIKPMDYLCSLYSTCMSFTGVYYLYLYHYADEFSNLTGQMNVDEFSITAGLTLVFTAINNSLINNLSFF